METKQKFGWGLPDSTATALQGAENKKLDQLASIAPRFFQRRAAKPVNAEMLAAIKELQTKDGVTSGFFFRYVEAAIFKKPLDWVAQPIGSCVTSGFMRTFGVRSLVESFLLDQADAILGEDIISRNNLTFFGPDAYRGGRRLIPINGGRPDGSDDGSLCLPQIEFAMKHGLLPCSTPGLESDSFPEPKSTALYRAWGADDRLISKFLDSPRVQLLESEPVRNFEAYSQLVREHYKPVNICSDWAFKATRDVAYTDAKGPVYYWTRDTSNVWHHNMSGYGCGDTFSEVKNQWDEYHQGRDFFILRNEEMDRYLRSQNTVAQSVGDIALPANVEPWPVS